MNSCRMTGRAVLRYQCCCDLEENPYTKNAVGLIRIVNPVRTFY